MYENFVWGPRAGIIFLVRGAAVMSNFVTDIDINFVINLITNCMINFVTNFVTNF